MNFCKKPFIQSIYFNRFFSLNLKQSFIIIFQLVSFFTYFNAASLFYCSTILKYHHKDASITSFVPFNRLHHTNVHLWIWFSCDCFVFLQLAPYTCISSIPSHLSQKNVRTHRNTFLLSDTNNEQTITRTKTHVSLSFV